MNDTSLLIGDADTGTQTGSTFEPRSPITGEVARRSAGVNAGIAEFTDLRWVSIATQHRHYPI